MKSVFSRYEFCGKIKYHEVWVEPSPDNLLVLKQLLGTKKVELVSTHCLDCLEKEER